MKRRVLWTIFGIATACFCTIFVGVLRVGKPRITSAVYAWLPDGNVFRVSPEKGTYYQACIHPDGSSVIFAGADTGPPVIWKADLPSGELHQLTPSDTAAFQGTYSWDGERIIFSSDRVFAAEYPSIRVEDAKDPRKYRDATGARGVYRNFNLFEMEGDGENVTQISHGAFRDLRATYSPDGTQLAFFSTRSPFGPLWTMPSDGSSEPVRIPLGRNPPWSVFRPWYTVDGKELYFFGNILRPGQSIPKIGHIPLEGGQPEPLGWEPEGRSAGPFLPQEGGVLLFHTDSSGRPELWEYPLDGAAPRMLVPPNLDMPADRKVMHPTRAKNGTMTFDVSYREGSALHIFLLDTRAWLGRLRKRISQ